MFKIFESENEALQYMEARDTGLGYPKSGVNIGDGIHVSDIEGYTLRETDIIKDPNSKSVALQIVDVELSANVPKGIVDVEAIDETWIVKDPKIEALKK